MKKKIKKAEKYLEEEFELWFEPDLIMILNYHLMSLIEDNLYVKIKSIQRTHTRIHKINWIINNSSNFYVKFIFNKVKKFLRVLVIKVHYYWLYRLVYRKFIGLMGLIYFLYNRFFFFFFSKLLLHRLVSGLLFLSPSCWSVSF